MEVPNESELSTEELGKQRDTELEQGRMAFAEHIRELRDRVRNAVIGVAIGFAVSLAFSEELFVLLAQPLVEAWAEQSPTNEALGPTSFYFTGLIEPFWTFFSLSFWSGIFLSSPVIFYQVWSFIAPGLYKKERWWGMLFACVSALLFVAGATFCYMVVLPAVCEFLLGYATTNLSDVSSQPVALQPLLTMKEFVNVAKKLLIGFGLIFELPLIILVLSVFGLVTHRSLWKFNRWAVLIAFVVSAALTPPDIYSQLFMAGPLVVLYNLSIIISFFITIRRERRNRQDGPESESESESDS